MTELHEADVITNSCFWKYWPLWSLSSGTTVKYEWISSEKYCSYVN